jgi:hypothetical protein
MPFRSFWTPRFDHDIPVFGDGFVFLTWPPDKTLSSLFTRPGGDVAGIVRFRTETGDSLMLDIRVA